jgi:pimeloyl-ACP methyl ester carboxylesterase
MRKILLYTIALLGVWILLARCFVAKNRWSDGKAQKVFAAKQVPLQMKDTVIDGRHLHYAISGPDHLPTLVFLHGSPGSWMNYMKFMWDTALQRKFRMVSIDRPGFGYSNFGHAMHLQEQCNMILPVLQSLKNERSMYLCGHSFGGPVVVQLAAMDTTLCNTIVIAAGALDLGQEKTETWRKIMHVKPLHWLLPGAFAPSNTELLYLKKDLAKLQGEFKKVTCKVHFIHGDKDTWVPIKNIAYGQKMLVNAQRITADTLVGADHQIPWKNKQEFTDMLLGLY